MHEQRHRQGALAFAAADLARVSARIRLGDVLGDLEDALVAIADELDARAAFESLKFFAF